MMELDTIYLEDCLKGMKDIPDNSIDMICCDLPYGQLNKNSEGGRWDSVIPLDSLWEQYNRIIKRRGAIVLFAQGMFTAQLMMSQPNKWKYNLIWDKVNRPTSFLNAHRRQLRIHEDIVVFYSHQPTYNPQMTTGMKAHRRGAIGKTVLIGGKNRCYDKYKLTNPDYSNEKYPNSIISIEKEHTGKEFHPTQKPVNLIRYLIRTYSNEGDVVLDNCMGSGTTAVACIKEKRHFIGYETNKDYYDLACKRIQQAQEQLLLF